MSRTGVVGWVVVVAATLGGVWWTWGRPEASSAAGVIPDERPIAPEHEQVAVELQAAAPPAPVDQRAEAAAPLQEPPQHTAQAATATATVTMRGSAVVTDERGIEHRQESGSIALVLWEQPTVGINQDVPVENGNWSIDVAAGTGMSVSEAKLGGRTAIALEQNQRLEISEDLVELRFRWPRRSVLFVRDHVSHRDLDQIELVLGGGWPAGAAAHPGRLSAQQKLYDSTSSPIDLSAAELGWSQALFARSPGYAWGRITIEEKLGGERMLFLEPGGDLALDLIGHDPSDQPSLRLRVAEGSEPALDLQLGRDAQVRIESLVPATYRASVEIGDSWDEPLVLGSGEVEVRAGELAHLALTLEAPPRLEAVALSGTLVMPSAWELEDFKLEFELLDTALSGSRERGNIRNAGMRRIDDETWAWRFGGLQPGHYEFNVPECFYSISTELPPGGLENLSVEVPPPVRVSVLVIEKHTGRKAELERIAWFSQRPQWVTGGNLQSVSPDPETGRFDFKAPRTTIVLHVWSQEYQWVGPTYDLREGRSEFTLELEPACGLILSVVDGDTRLPWSDDWHIRPREVEGPGSARGWSSGAEPGQRRILLTGPGLYRFEMPEVPGYEPIAEQERWVPAGEFVEHVIELTRRP